MIRTLMCIIFISKSSIMSTINLDGFMIIDFPLFLCQLVSPGYSQSMKPDRQHLSITQKGMWLGQACLLLSRGVLIILI